MGGVGSGSALVSAGAPSTTPDGHGAGPGKAAAGHAVRAVYRRRAYAIL